MAPRDKMTDDKKMLVTAVICFTIALIVLILQGLGIVV